MRIRQVWKENFEVYGVRKVWRELRRQVEPGARCTVGRLMDAMGLTGAVRGRKFMRTTSADDTAPRPRGPSDCLRIVRPDDRDNVTREREHSAPKRDVATGLIARHSGDVLVHLIGGDVSKGPGREIAERDRPLTPRAGDGDG